MDEYVFLPLMSEVGGSDVLPGSNGNMVGSMGGTGWVALCLVHMIHLPTQSAMTALTLGQQTVAWVSSCIFLVPQWPLCRSASVLLYNLGGGVNMQSPFRTMSSSRDNSFWVPQKFWAIHRPCKCGQAIH